MFQKPLVLCACKLLIHGRREATLGLCQNHLVLAHRKRHLRTTLTDRVHCSAERLTEYLRCDPAFSSCTIAGLGRSTGTSRSIARTALRGLSWLT